LQACAIASVPVVGADDDAGLMEPAEREIDRGAVVSAGDGDVVIEGVSRVEELAPVVVGGGAGIELRAPGEARGLTVGRVAASGDGAGALAVGPLQRHGLVHI